MDDAASVDEEIDDPVRSDGDSSRIAHAVLDIVFVGMAVRLDLAPQSNLVADNLAGDRLEKGKAHCTLVAGRNVDISRAGFGGDENCSTCENRDHVSDLLVRGIGRGLAGDSFSYEGGGHDLE